MKSLSCDVLVAGSGAGGFTAALASRCRGLDVIMVEKEPLFGGTTAYSAGMPWVPANSAASKKGHSPEKAMTYLQNEVGNRLDRQRAEAYLANCNAAIGFLNPTPMSASRLSRSGPTIIPICLAPRRSSAACFRECLTAVASASASPSCGRPCAP